jgi:YD repeat-containing protein
MQPIDTSLVEIATPTGRARVNKANAFRVTLPNREGASPVGIAYEDVGVYMSPQGRPFELPVHGARVETTATPVAGDARSRTYAGAYQGADIVYTSVARGLKETIVLNSYQGRSTFSFDMSCPGLTPSLETSTSIVFTRDTTGAVVFRMVPPYMEDSSKNEYGDPAESTDVFYRLQRTGSKWRLDLVADQKWLADPARVYPIMIDPTTYWEGSAGLWDTDVYSLTPTTNFGTRAYLRAGRPNTTYGTFRTYVKPNLDGLTGGRYSILRARLRLYNYDGTSGSVRINCAWAKGSWSEGGLTWNTQPIGNYMTYDWVHEGEWAEWDVTATVQNYVLGLSPNDGFRIYAEDESGAVDTYCHFYSRESGDSRLPVLSVTYTSTPTPTIVAPTLEVPVGNHNAHVHIHWKYEDALEKSQSKVHVELATAPSSSAEVWDSGAIACTDRVMRLGGASFNWQDRRYWVRMRAWGQCTEGAAAGTEAPSDWTAWQPFDRKDVTLASDGQGYSPVRASEPLGAGLFIDIPSGHLRGTRTDFSGDGLGGPLSYSAYYDSSVTADSGLGTGWQIGEPRITWNGQIAPNSSFEELATDGTNNPRYWIASDDVPVARVRANATPVSGSYYLMIGKNPSAGFFSAYVSNNAGGTSGTPVAPGERVSASAHVVTNSLTPDTTQAEYGALLRLHFYDGNGALVGTAASSGYRPFTTDTSPDGWRALGLEAVAPANAYYMKLSIEAKNLKGYTYWDSVSLVTHGFTFTDDDGTTRSFAQAGSGVYTRDPLEPDVRFSRVNAMRGAIGHSTSNASGSAGTDGVISSTAAYDSTLWGAYPTKYLQYELLHADVLSEIGMYLWDGVEATPRTYTYRIDVSEDGAHWTQVVAQTTGWSWVTHTFTPRRVRFVRVYALGNSANEAFHIREVEAPVLKLADSTLAFNSPGNIVATADPSGNPTFHSPYLGDALSSVSETPDGTTGRRLVLSRSGSRVSSLSWTGIDSAGNATTASGIVAFQQTATEYKALRTNDGVAVPVLTYSYDASNRIVGAEDADGVGFSVHYDGSGRVDRVTRMPGDPSETITTYTYGTNQVTIATAATTGGAAAPMRVVTYKPASLGYQLESVTTMDPTGADPVTSVVYDEYGQPWKVVDPLGRYMRTERDGRGNVLVTAQCTASGQVLRQTLADYNQDHVVRTFDAKSNEAGYQYDSAWRILNALQVTGTSVLDGSTTAQRSYDEWGNTVTGGSPTSTAYNLLRNGTFELNPLTAGNGWDGPRQGNVQWEPTVGDPYLGDHTLLLGDYNAAPYITSDAIPVAYNKTYALSAWMHAWGQIHVLEYNSGGTQLQDTAVLQNAAGYDESETYRRVAAAFAPRADTATMRIRVQRDVDGAFSVDNIRLEMANASSPDSFTENESMEQSASGLPRAWYRRPTAETTAVHEQHSSTKAAGIYSARIGHSSSSAEGYFYSDLIYVNPAEVYSVSVSMKTTGSLGGSYVGVYYYNASGASVGSASATGGPIKNTTDWTRYATEITVPQGADRMRVRLVHNAGGGDAYYDAVSVTPGGGISTAAYDLATHTHRISGTNGTDITTTATYDSRNRRAGARRAFAPTRRGVGVYRVKSIRHFEPGMGVMSHAPRRSGGPQSLSLLNVLSKLTHDIE